MSDAEKDQQEAAKAITHHLMAAFALRLDGELWAVPDSSLAGSRLRRKLLTSNVSASSPPPTTHHRQEFRAA